MLEIISEKAKSIKGYGSLSAITQIILLIDDIESAKSLGISNTLICDAINSGGGKIKQSYFTEALHYARKSPKIEQPSHLKKPNPKASASHLPYRTYTPVSAKQAREEKAKEYTSPISNNPIFKKHVKPNKE